MDKVIRVIQGANGVLTCGQKVLYKPDFRPNNSVGRGKRKGEREKGRNLRKRSSTFSLGFLTIGPVEQEEKCFPAQRVSSRDRKRGVLTNFKN